jgi:hypothetical protein
MPEDRSLDEFAAGPSRTDEAGDAEAGDAEAGDAESGDEQSGGAADAESGDASDTPATDAEGGDAEVTPDATGVDPAVPTATWTADPTACERCGERVSRRWLDDDDLVCGDCKAW